LKCWQEGKEEELEVSDGSREEYGRLKEDGRKEVLM
jgi:hypothetical protein